MDDRMLGDDVLDGAEDGAEFHFGPVVPDPIHDGSQVVAHDGYDVQMFDEAMRSYGRLADVVQHATQRVITAPALYRDLFWSFYQRTVVTEPPAPLNQAYGVNQQIVQQIMGTTEWRQVREAGTVGDVLNSAMATIGVAEKALAALDQATVQHINHLHELESGAHELFRRAEGLDDLAQQAQGDQAQALFDQARALQRAAAAKLGTAAQDVDALEADSEAREDAVRRAARQGLQQAEGAIDETNAAINTFSGGYGPGHGFGKGGQPLTTKDKIALAQRVGQSKRLQQLAQLCGRFTRIALAVQRSKVDHPPDEVTNITFGDELEHVLPSELALLADADLEDLFFLRFAEKSLLQYELIGSEKQGRGPIIVALDESYSMTSTFGGSPYSKELWSKAVTLALLAIARLQQRDFVVIHFAHRGQMQLHRFPKGEGSYPDVIPTMDSFFGGGTDFEPWMEQALTLVEETALNKADVICVSDGLAEIDRATLERWQRVRKLREMRAYAVLIGTNGGADVLASITNALLTLDNLGEDTHVLQTIFAV